MSFRKYLHKLEAALGEKLFEVSIADEEKTTGYILNESKSFIGVKLRISKLEQVKEIASVLSAIDTIHTLILSGSRDHAEAILSQGQKYPLFEDTSQGRTESDDWISAFSRIRNLQRLEITNLRTGPLNSLSNHQKLSYLKLSGGEISDFPQLKGLINLTHLNLNKNKITSIHSLSGLYKLKHLDLSENRIENIYGLDKLRSLSIVDLSNNKIKDVEILGKLRQLKIVNINGNMVSEITPLEALAKTNKTSVFFFSNFVRNIPFHIYHNLLKARIPDILPGLKNTVVRTQKYEEAAQLRDVEKKLLAGQIPTMSQRTLIRDRTIKYLYDSNPIESPPFSTVQEGGEAVARYFKNLVTSEIDSSYEGKLILVGEGGSGKTSLQVRLMDPEAELPNEEHRTRGIKLNDWRVSPNIGQFAVIHIWDFGGQDVYYPVHRFFLNQDSVYVLLGTTRHINHNFDYWVQTIFQFAGKSPIILGQTCHDGNSAPWNEVSRYLTNQDYNIIKTGIRPYYEIDLKKNNLGLEEIKKVIINQLSSLPSYGKKMFAPWAEVRRTLEAKTQSTPCLTYDEFMSLCRAVDGNFFKNSVDIDDCGRFLDEIGAIIWYHKQEYLKNWVILRPQWLMDTFYKLIDDEEIRDQRGTIKLQDFERIWAGPEFEGRHLILKKTLEIFKIAFPKRHFQSEFILPVRLESIPTEKIWTKEEEQLRIEYHYNFMPKGMVNQLSAELSRYIISDNEVWNDAVNFGNETKTASCQVHEVSDTRVLLIKAKGADARDLVVLVKNALKNVMEEYKGVNPKILVPCTCSFCKKSPSPNTFVYETLLKYLAEKEDRTVTCNESEERIYVKNILFNAGLFEKLPANKNKIVKIFLASSAELKEDRLAFQTMISEQNKLLIKDGIFLEEVVWEDFIDAMSRSRLQEEYNQALIKCDIFVCLFFSKVGKYTSEEFERAFGAFKESTKPFIYTYFKNADLKSGNIGDEIQSMLAFKKRLKELEHFPTEYANHGDLKYHFKSQLEKLFEAGMI